MADQAKLVKRQGTPIVFGEAGASGVTKTLSLDGLAAGSARMSASFDLGADVPDEVIVEARMESGSAPTAGGAIDVYIAWSSDNSNWPGGVTGSDGAWPSDGNEDEWAKQLGPPVLSVIASNDGTTIQRQGPRRIPAKARYGVVVVDNNWDQALRDETTATDNDSRVVITPFDTVAVDP